MTEKQLKLILDRRKMSDRMRQAVEYVILSGYTAYEAECIFSLSKNTVRRRVVSVRSDLDFSHDVVNAGDAIEMRARKNKQQKEEK